MTLIRKKLTIVSLMVCVTYASAQNQVNLIVNSGDPGVDKALLTPDNKYLVSGGERIIIWDIISGLPLWDISHEKTIRTFDLDHTGRTIIVGTYDGNVFAIETLTGRIKWEIKLDNSILSLDASPVDDIFMCITGNFSGTISSETFVISTEEGEILSKPKTSFGYSTITNPKAEQVQFNTEGDIVALAAMEEGLVVLYEAPTKANVYNVTFKSRTDYYLAGLSRQTHRARMSVGSGKAYIYTIEFYGLISDYEGSFYVTEEGKKIEMDKLEFDLKDQMRLNTARNEISWYHGNEITLNKIIDIKEEEIYNNKKYKIIFDAKTLTAENEIRDIQYSTDNHFLTSSGLDGVSVWHLQSASIVNQFKGRVLQAMSMDISPDGRYLATQLGSFGKSFVKIWDVYQGKVVLSIETGLEQLNEVKFSSDGQYLIGGGRNMLKAWGVKTGQLVQTYEGFEGLVKNIYHTKDGNFMLSDGGIIGGTSYINVWDFETGEKLRSIDQGCDGYGFDVSPDGLTLITGAFCDDQTMKFWEISTGKMTGSVKDKNLIFREMHYSKDGNYILTRGSLSPNSDAALRKASNGKVIVELNGILNPTKMLFTSNSNLALIEDEDPSPRICVFDLQNNIIQKEIPLANLVKGKVSQYFLSPDDQILFVTTSLGTVELLDFQTLKNIATFVTLGDANEYISFLPDNFYRSSKDAGNGIVFSVDGRSYPFDQFDLRYNRPDLLVKSLGFESPELISAYEAAYVKRIKKMGFDRKSIEGEVHIPEIEILTPNIPQVSESKTILLKVKATDDRVPLDRLNVYINDVPIYGIKGFSVKNQNVNAVEKEFKIELSSGRNKIQVSAHNISGFESFRKTIVTNCNAPIPASNLYVVAIGVSDYQDDDFDLTYAAKDARDIISTYSKDESFGQVVKLEVTDKNATVENIRAVKQKLYASGVDDMVVLFVAGHGLVDEKLDYYFATHDVDFYNPSIRGLSYDDLEGLLDGIPARRKLMLIDACHSGEIDKEETQLITADVSSGSVSSRGFKTLENKKKLGFANSYDMMSELFADLRRGTGAMVISSASGVEFAFESDAWKNGVFTYALLEGLQNKKCDSNKDREIRVSELRNYVFDRVVQLTDGKQHPTSRRENLEFDFVVW